MYCIVSGDANFATMITIGGFTKPGVARSLIEAPTNMERGFSHRFLWYFPAPLYESFSSLCEIKQTIVVRIEIFTLLCMIDATQ